MVLVVGVDEMRVLGEAIIRFRGKHNLSQLEFANRCGLSRATVISIESGRLRDGRNGITALTKAKIQNIIESED